MSETDDGSPSVDGSAAGAAERAASDPAMVPEGYEYEVLDVRDLPPPEPLTETIERLAGLDEGTVLLQVNDRAPQHLYPRLEKRGFAHETVEAASAVVTAIRQA